jgi:hypothetical protein
MASQSYYAGSNGYPKQNQSSDVEKYTAPQTSYNPGNQWQDPYQGQQHLQYQNDAHYQQSITVSRSRLSFQCSE